MALFTAGAASAMDGVGIFSSVTLLFVWAQIRRRRRPVLHSLSQAAPVQRLATPLPLRALRSPKSTSDTFA